MLFSKLIAAVSFVGSAFASTLAKRATEGIHLVNCGVYSAIIVRTSSIISRQIVWTNTTSTVPTTATAASTQTTLTNVFRIPEPSRHGKADPDPALSALVSRSTGTSCLMHNLRRFSPLLGMYPYLAIFTSRNYANDYIAVDWMDSNPL